MDYTFNELVLDQIDQLMQTEERIFLPIEALSPGMMVSEDIYDKNSFLVKKDTILNEQIIMNLQRRSIQHVPIYVYGNQSKYKEELDIMSDNIKTYLSNVKFLNHQILERLYDTAKILPIYILKLQNTYDIGEYKDNLKYSLASHSLRVCKYSLLMAYNYNKTTDANKKIKYEDIAMASLLHDIGCVCENSVIRSQIKYVAGFDEFYPGLQKAKLAEIKNNYNKNYDPYYAFCILFNEPKVSKTAKFMILHSKENERGTGPFGFTKMHSLQNNIHDLPPEIVGAQIINICSTFDKEMCNQIGEETKLENITAFIQSLEKTHSFNAELLNLLVQSVPILPFGTKVKLMNALSDVGIVIANHSNLEDYHRPKVFLPSLNKVIDLKNNPEVKIVDIYEKTKLMAKLLEENETPKL